MTEFILIKDIFLFEMTTLLLAIFCKQFTLIIINIRNG
jgi:hypothetical protein